MIGVLHHIPSVAEKLGALRAIGCRLVPGAPFIPACNCREYSSAPRLMAAWKFRWIMAGLTEDQASRRLDTSLKAAAPVRSEQELAELLSLAGCESPAQFFRSLLWGAWDYIE